MIDLDEIVEDVIRAYERRTYRSHCAHCGRVLRGIRTMCGNCAKRPGHSPEDRLLATVFNEPLPCCNPDVSA